MIGLCAARLEFSGSPSTLVSGPCQRRRGYGRNRFEILLKTFSIVYLSGVRQRQRRDDQVKESVYRSAPSFYAWFWASNSEVRSSGMAAPAHTEPFPEPVLLPFSKARSWMVTFNKLVSVAKGLGKHEVSHVIRRRGREAVRFRIGYPSLHGARL